MNPYIQACPRKGAYVSGDGGQCVNLDSDVVDGCVSWAQQKEAMGAWRSWITALEPYGFWDSKNKHEGDGQICFLSPSWSGWLWFWIFVFCEIMSVICNMTATQLNWRVVRRGARLLSDLNPRFPKDQWPEVCARESPRARLHRAFDSRAAACAPRLPGVTHRLMF